MKSTTETVHFQRIVGGGQTIGTCDDGRKAFVWGGLPGEVATIRITKKKSRLIEGVVTEIHAASSERIAPQDPDCYLSTSPWQIMTFDAEQRYKSVLIKEAFELHGLTLPYPIEVYSDSVQYGYRNKVEFSWYGSDRESHKTNSDELANRERLDLAFFRRGSKGKIPVDGTSLARDEINTLARAIRDLLASKPDVTARNLKTLLIRCNQSGTCVWQLYVKDKLPGIISLDEAAALPAQGGEVIYSDPRSPASRITERLASFGNIVLEDRVLDVPFRYATEGFFQVNIPIYEQALRDMRGWLAPASDQPSAPSGKHVIDMYSGVGTIGLTIGGDNCTLVEIDENAVREMRRNITELGINAQAILAPSEKALEHITSDQIVIVDPPRTGLHADVVARLLETMPSRIIYLSCNPVTQARDISLLTESYRISYHRGYNFFPRTPHIEHLVVLDII